MTALLLLALLQPDDPASPWTFTEREGLRTSDGDFNLHIGGVFAIEGTKYDSRNPHSSKVRMGRMVIRIEGQINPTVSFRIAPDLSGIDTDDGFDEAWVSWEPDRRFRLTVGLIDIPAGLENGIPEEDLSFIRYAFPAWITGRTDYGGRIEGEFDEGIFYYDIGVASGEGFDLDGHPRGDHAVSLRLNTYPFMKTGWGLPLSGFFVTGFINRTWDWDVEMDINTPLRTSMFNMGRNQARASYNRHVGWGFDAGSVRFMHEWTAGWLRDLETPFGKKNFANELKAWGMSVSVMLTGETYDTRPYRAREGRTGPFPIHPMDGEGEDAGGGAFELGVRYSNADIDRRFFDFGILSYIGSSQEFRFFEGAATWYPTSYLRVTFMVERVIADDHWDPITLEPSGRDTSFMLRVQYDF